MRPPPALRNTISDKHDAALVAGRPPSTISLARRRPARGVSAALAWDTKASWSAERFLDSATPPGGLLRSARQRPLNDTTSLDLTARGSATGTARVRFHGVPTGLFVPRWHILTCMPVPQPSAEPQRQLIRDVAYSRIRDEILDGQLEPGEKLNDADLTAWLQVSRTPIREAIAMLAADGLIEMEPNRYTRIPDRSPDAYRRAAEYMHMIRGFTLEHLDRIPSKDLRATRKRMVQLLPQLRAHDRGAQIAFNDEFGELAALIDNPLITAAEQRVRSQAQFHLQHPDAAIDWDHITSHAQILIETDD